MSETSTTNLPEILTTTTIAAYFDVTERTARRWLDAGDLGPFTRIGPKGRKVLLRETLLEHLRCKERSR